MKEWLKIILFGFGIIGYLIAYGTNQVFALRTIHELYLEGFFSETQYNLFYFAYPVIGISFFIGIVVYFAFNTSKKHLCNNCKLKVSKE